MTRGNRPRGRCDTGRPRTTSSADVFEASVGRYGAVAMMLRGRRRTNAFLVGAQVLDRLAEVIEDEVVAGQRHRQTEE